MVASGEGVQVLFVEEDGRYRCDEDALRRVLGGAGVARSLPVAVVSVAGATRGGKSFLLDFFLRYLRAPEAVRRSGAWLGEPDQPLTGFSWRGGCERHTEGILIWSEPIIVSLGPENKFEKVAVVLLDTQGSFDSSSTMRDSSTVFALSTLLASVQVYNLSQNIKEDDLQYLQLFTEYGKLAREEEAEKPFQELKFLVRDWSFAYDHPIGAEGGQQLLDKRLEIRPEQASELREIRAHVRGAFERVRGFLLPHPGLTVATNPAFTGCLKDISDEFKNAILELVPSLFGSENLTIKHINGQTLTLQDFCEYFKSYVDVFNSDTLPTPITVFQATSLASLEAALNACRNEYSAHLERCAGGAACVPRDALPQHHDAALQAARQAFGARRTLAAPVLAAARLDALLKELDSSLADYVAINSGRILEAAARCKAGYEAAMLTDKCLMPDEITQHHNTAVASAKKAFYAEFRPRMEDHDEASREQEDNTEEHEDYAGEREDDTEEHEDYAGEREDDTEEHEDYAGEREDDTEEYEDNEDWKTLEKELDELLPLHRERNAERIAAARVSALDLHERRMRDAVDSAPCLHPQSLDSVHNAAVDAATEQMLSAWHDANTVPEELKEELCICMVAKCRDFIEINKTDNENAVEEALTVYKDIMTEIVNEESGQCLHPLDFKAEHERAQRAASAHFLELRDSASHHLPVDSYQNSVHRGTIVHFLKFEESNDNRNKAAVKEAHEHYLRNVSPLRANGNMLLELLSPPDANVFIRHPTIRRDAIELFKMKRRSFGNVHSQDLYLNDLNKKIQSSYSMAQLRVVAGYASTAVSIVGLSSAMFLARR